MRKVLLILSLLTRNKIDTKITPISHANSTNSWLAMMTKFCLATSRMMPRMAAKVTTVIAMMMQGRFAMKLSLMLSNLPRFTNWVIAKRMTKRLRDTEIRP